MIYDLIVIGAGPAGLSAAKTAAHRDLRVALVEKRKDISAPFKADGSMFYFYFLTPEIYIEPVTVETGTGAVLEEGSRVKPRHRFSFDSIPGLSIEYTGQVIPLFNYVNLSPAGYRVYAIKDEFWAFYFSREHLAADMLAAVKEAGAEIMTGSAVLTVENVAKGARVRIKAGKGERTIEAKKVIAADGPNSIIADSLGLNKDRPVIGQNKSIAYIIEGVDFENSIQDELSWMSFNIPSISPAGILLGHFSEVERTDTKQIISSSVTALERFMAHKRYAPWFSSAKLLRKLVVPVTARTPLKDLAFGNVWFAGDSSGGLTGIMGGIASGYQAAKAILMDLDGRDGYPEYKEWFYNAFACFTCKEHDKRRLMHRLFRQICTDDDVDYIYLMLQGEICHPPFVIFENPNYIKAERPQLYEKVMDILENIDNIPLKP